MFASRVLFDFQYANFVTMVGICLVDVPVKIAKQCKGFCFVFLIREEVSWLHISGQKSHGAPQHLLAGRRQCLQSRVGVLLCDFTIQPFQCQLVDILVSAKSSHASEIWLIHNWGRAWDNPLVQSHWDTALGICNVWHVCIFQYDNTECYDRSCMQQHDFMCLINCIIIQNTMNLQTTRQMVVNNSKMLT